MGICKMKVALLSLVALCVAVTWAASDGVHTVSALDDSAEPAATQHAAGKVPPTAKTKETAQAKKAVATTVTKKSPVAKKKKPYAKRVKRIVDRSRAALGEFQQAGRRASMSAASEMQQGCIMTAAQNPQSSTMNSAAVCAGKAGAYFKHPKGITLTAKYYEPKKKKKKKKKMKEEDFGKEAEEEAIEGELVAVEY